ncbi:MAG: YCF48-related protein [Candidatus Udaeobacter sp.]
MLSEAKHLCLFLVLDSSNFDPILRSAQNDIVRKILLLTLGIVSYSSLTAFGQWSAANSGTTNNLNGVYLLDSGIAFVVGDAGTVVKTTDAGMTWSPLTSGTTNALYAVYFFDATQGVAVGEQGLILRTTECHSNSYPYS